MTPDTRMRACGAHDGQRKSTIGRLTPEAAIPPVVRYAEGQSGGDYRVTIRISNARLWNAIKNQGFASFAAFCQDRGLRYGQAAKYLALALAPVTENGDIRPSAQLLADALGCDIEDIFPPAMLRHTLENRTIVRDISEDAVRAIVSRARSPDGLLEFREARGAVRDAVAKLRPRSRNALILRYGLDGSEPKTLDEIGEILKVGKERVRQIILKGERDLKHNSKSRPLAVHLAAFNNSVAEDEQ